MIGPMERAHRGRFDPSALDREWVAEESVLIDAAPERVYAAVADPRAMTAWSPELFAVWMRRRPVEEGLRFTGWNRRGPFVWFTGCEVTAAVSAEVFAFRVRSFRLPVALWGYRLEAVPGGTRLTEYWQDLRRDHRGAVLGALLGRIFTGVKAGDRAGVNRDGMRATLERIKATVEMTAK
jgi:uncharacterized protein YndB with AHSA1/START domain